jgi:hypothetical protein
MPKSPATPMKKRMRKMPPLTDPYNLPVPAYLEDAAATTYVYYQISSLAGVNNFPFDCSPNLDVEMASTVTPDIELGLCVYVCIFLLVRSYQSRLQEGCSS